MTTNTDLVQSLHQVATTLPAVGAAAPVLAILLTALFAMVLLGKVMR